LRWVAACSSWRGPAGANLMGMLVMVGGPRSVP
jgi:hypothetical protein